MSGIASTLRRHWVEIAWAVFSGAAVAFILMMTRWETIPFHLIWVSLTLLYGFRVWKTSTTAVVLGAVIAATGSALIWTVIRGHEALDEVVEVPLMASMFLAMAWHAKRRQRAVEEAERAAETERRVLDRQRGFVRDASHELRTPITVARGHAELIRTMSDDPRSSADAEVIMSELDRLSRLSDRLLTLAAADHPSFLSPEPVSVPELLTETAARWGPATDRDLRVAIAADGTVSIDRGRLESALDALIENAVRAGDPGSAIELSATAEGATVVFTVSDRGVGIGPDELPHIFDRFSRRDPDRGRGTGGTGLGLAIVKAIVEAHGGTVEAESRLGVGTAVRMRLPGYSEPDASEGPVPLTALPVRDPALRAVTP
ncbi:MAG TPA: HAMP domain-containing sensor histidine kinase [Actinomycetota bacterium]|jgi:signal transduction histidine kinase